MTKNEELAVLDRAIRELGSSSYLGPWLAEVRKGVETLMRSDLEPAAFGPTPVEAKRAAGQIIADARREAESILGDARRRADKVTTDAFASAQNVSHGAAAKLRDLADKLDGRK